MRRIFKNEAEIMRRRFRNEALLNYYSDNINLRPNLTESKIGIMSGGLISAFNGRSN